MQVLDTAEDVCLLVPEVVEVGVDGREEQLVLVVVEQQLVGRGTGSSRQRATMNRAYHAGQSGSGSPRSVSYAACALSATRNWVRRRSSVTIVQSSFSG